MAVERKFINDSIIKLQISNYLKGELTKAGFSSVDIQKTPVLTRITLHLLLPGKAIGPGGKNINRLTEEIKSKFNLENPQINVIEVENKILVPILVARDIAFQLERNINARKLIQQTLANIMRNGAIGAEIVLSGKLAAKGARAKSMRKSVGYIPKSGELKNYVTEAKLSSYPKYGAIGVKVRIVQPGTVLPGMGVPENKIIPPVIKPANAVEEKTKKDNIEVKEVKTEKPEEKVAQTKTEKPEEKK